MDRKRSSDRGRGACALMVAIVMLNGCAAASYRYAYAETTAPMTSSPADAEGLEPSGDETATPAPDASVGEPAPQVPASAARRIIYTGELHLLARDVSAAQRAIEQLAAARGGYLHELKGEVVVVKVPAPRFNDLVDAVAALGEVPRRQIQASDVTEQLFDLRTRLKSSQAMLDRLIAMLEKAGEMKDALAIEKEIQRLTETIELLKGKVRFLETHVAFATLTVRVNTPVPQAKTYESVMPFAWVRALGSELARPGGSADDADRKLHEGVRVNLPADFVRYYQDDYLTRAISADQVIIRIERHDNYDEGQLEFWADAARRSVMENQAIRVAGDAVTVPLGRGGAARLLYGSRRIGQRDLRYLLAIAVSRRYVYTFEVWGPAELMDARYAALEQAIRTVDAR